MNSFKRSLCAVMALFISEALTFQYQRNLLTDSEHALAEQERLKYRAAVIQTVVVDSLKVRDNFMANFNRPYELGIYAQDGLKKCKINVAELRKLSRTEGSDERANGLVLELASSIQTIEPFLQQIVENGTTRGTSHVDSIANLVIVKKLNPLLDNAFAIVKTINTYDQMLLAKTTEHDRELREQQGFVLLIALIFKVLVALSVVIILSRDTNKRIRVLLNNMTRLKANQALNSNMKGDDEICALDSSFHNMADELNYYRRQDQEIFENVVDLIFTLDRNLNFVKMSKSVWIFCRKQEAEIEGASVLELTLPSQRVNIKEQFDKSRQLEDSSSFELLTNTETQSRILLLSSKWSSESEQFFCIAHDITERKAREQLIVDNEQRIRKILEALPIGITVSTAEGKLEFANEIACRVCQWNSLQLPKQNIPELLDSQSRGSLLEVAATSGLNLPIELSTTEFETSDGKRILSAFQNISERVELQTAKNTFLAMISHDIRSPLQTVSSFLENLHVGRYGQIPAELHNTTSNLVRSTKLVNRLINDLLDVEKLESGSFLLNQEPACLLTLINEAIDVVDSFSAEKGVDFECKISEDLEVEVDTERIVQVLVNIFTNAIKFSPEGTVVTIKTEVNSSFTKVIIIDRGRGIAPELRPLIFSKFRQAYKEDNRRNYGSGLGLAIAKLIVELHGGTIGLESEINNGSTFWFTVKTHKAN